MIYNILLIGYRESGKTTYINRLSTGEFNPHYTPTTSNIYNVLDFNTKNGIIKFNVIETHDYDNNITNIDGVILMYDCNFKVNNTYINYYLNKYKNLPVIVCGNKIDLGGEKYYYEERLYNNYNVIISSKSNYHFEKPFLYLARHLTKDLNLEFIAMEAIETPVVEYVEE